MLPLLPHRSIDVDGPVRLAILVACLSERHRIEMFWNKTVGEGRRRGGKEEEDGEAWRKMS